ncbi:MAG: hypothetical protein AAF577_08930 [Pseudomonadota bacterium]
MTARKMTARLLMARWARRRLSAELRATALAAPIALMTGALALAQQPGDLTPLGDALFSAGPSPATVHVAPNGRDDPTCQRESTPCASVAHGLARLQSLTVDNTGRARGTLVLAKGVYPAVDLVIPDQTTIRGAGRPLQTVLDAGGAGRVLSIPAGARVTIENLSIGGGRVIGVDATALGQDGGVARGAGVLNEGDLTLRGVMVAENRVEGGTGALGTQGKPDKGVAQYGGNGGDGGDGGRALGAGIYNVGALLLENVAVGRNIAQGGQAGRGGDGGDGTRGARGRNATFGRGAFNCKVRKPGGRGGQGGIGGGAGLGGSGGTALGAGVYSVPGATLKVDGARFFDNEVIGGKSGRHGADGKGGPGGFGGNPANDAKGICLGSRWKNPGPQGEKGGRTVTRIPIRPEGGEYGGAIAVDMGGTREQDLAADETSVEIANALIVANRAHVGAGLYFWHSARREADGAPDAMPVIEHVTIVGNQVDWGAAALFSTVPVTLSNSVAWGNTLTRGNDRLAYSVQENLGASHALRRRLKTDSQVIGEDMVLRAVCLEGMGLDDLDRSEAAGPLPAGALIEGCEPRLDALAGPDGKIGTIDDDPTPARGSSLIDAGAPPLIAGALDLNGDQRLFDHPFHAPPSWDGRPAGPERVDVGAVEAWVEPGGWLIGEAIAPPEAAVASLDAAGRPMPHGQPRIESEAEAFQWDPATRQLYAVRRTSESVTLWWPTAAPGEGAGESGAPAEGAPIFGRTEWPEQAQIHVAGAEVPIAPGVGLRLIGIQDPGGSAAMLGDRFTNAVPDTHSLLVFAEGEGTAGSAAPLRFLAVRTVDGYGILAERAACSVGAPILDARHQGPRGGHLLDPLAPVFPGEAGASALDGTASIIAVNASAAVPDHPLAVAWYRRGTFGIAWPDLVVGYDCTWPETWPGHGSTLTLTDPHGSGPWDEAGGLFEATVYAQGDPSLPGYNPNDEHAFFDVETAHLHALRMGKDDGAVGAGRHVVVQYRRSQDGPWQIAVLRLYLESPEHPLGVVGAATAGSRIARPAQILAAGGGACAATELAGPVFRAEDRSLFATAASVAPDLRVRWFYPMRADFAPVPGSKDADCLPWLGPISDGIDSTATQRFTARWPEDAPELRVGQSLIEPLSDATGIRLLHGRDLGLRLFDPMLPYAVDLATLPGAIEVDARGMLTGLPYGLEGRLSHVDGRLRLRGFIDRANGPSGLPLLHPSRLTAADTAALEAADPSADPAFLAAIRALQVASNAGEVLDVAALEGPGVLATTAMRLGPEGTAHATLLLDDVPGGPGARGLVVRLSCAPYAAPVVAVPSRDVFDDRTTLRYWADFGGDTDDLQVEWRLSESADGSPVLPAPRGLPEGWRYRRGGAAFDRGVAGTPGAVAVTVGAPSAEGLNDLFALARWSRPGGFCAGGEALAAAPLSGETAPADGAPPRPALAEGWVKRVLGAVNQFEQSERELMAGAEDIRLSAVALAGAPHEPGQTLGARDLSGVGLLRAYHTVFERARRLSIDRDDPAPYDAAASPDGGDPLLFAAGRMAALYKTLGDDAMADLADPTILLDTPSAGLQGRTTERFAFEEVLPSLLEEELALTRGLEAADTAPMHNRLAPNLSKGAAAGAIYLGAYGIQHSETAEDDIAAMQRGEVADLREDALSAYPQGHGDAYGHYLSGTEIFYDLMRHPEFTWPVGGERVSDGRGGSRAVDFREERLFAIAAAAKAEAGLKAAELTFRRDYEESDRRRLLGFKDRKNLSVWNAEAGGMQRVERAWGTLDWATRAGSGAYLDWVAGNALLPERDCAAGADCAAADETVRRIDRQTVGELTDLVDVYDTLQGVADRANSGLNPLGLPRGVVPFSLEASGVEYGTGHRHFAQIYERTLQRLDAANVALSLTMQDAISHKARRERQAELRREMDTREAEFRDRALRIFGGPYEEDIGPGRLYPPGYRGPDIYRHMVIDDDPAALFGEAFSVGSLFEIAFRPGQNVACYFMDGAPRDLASRAARSEECGSIYDTIAAEDPASALGSTLKVTNFTGDLLVNTLGTEVGAEFDDARIIAVSEERQTAVEAALGARDAGTAPTVRLVFSEGLRGMVKPAGYTSRIAEGRAGELQVLRRSMMREAGQLRQAIEEYEALLENLDGGYRKLLARIESQDLEQDIVGRALEKKQALDLAMIVNERMSEAAKASAESMVDVSEATADGVPTGFDDIASAGRASIRLGALFGSRALKLGAMALDINHSMMGMAASQVEQATQMQLMAGVARNHERLEEAQQLLETALREPQLRAAVMTQHEAVREAELRYQQAVAEGFRVLDDWMRVRRAMGADIVLERYGDALDRALQEESLAAYNEHFDIAARQVYQLAKAFDYETGGDAMQRSEYRALLAEILQERALGSYVQGQPVPGRDNGLVGIALHLNQSFDRYLEATRYRADRRKELVLSFRRELFDLDRDVELADSSDAISVLELGYVESRVDEIFAETVYRHFREDLREIPEIAECCIDDDRLARGPMPGLAIPFDTRIEDGLNLFGNPIGPGDQRPPSNAATVRIMSAAVLLEGFDWREQGVTDGFEAFVVPIGEDMVSGTADGTDLACSVPPRRVLAGREPTPKRCWTVVDAARAFEDRADVRPLRMLGTPTYAADDFIPGAAKLDKQLVGRSAENSGWLLVIPGEELLADPGRGVRSLLGVDADGTALGGGITDIQLFLEVYANTRPSWPN